MDPRVAPADVGFTPEQLLGWTEAERRLGVVTHAAGPTRRAHGGLDAIGGRDGDAFRAADAYRGPLSGYVFTSRDGAVGYYRDGAAAASGPRIALHLDALVPPAVDGTDPACGGGRTHGARRPRHARGADGKRLRARAAGRRPCSAEPTSPCAGHGELGDLGWKSRGMWLVVTSNPNSWTTAEARVLPATAADTLLLQETKLCGTAGVDKVSRRGRHFGWNATASEAHRTAADRASGGCMVAVRRGCGITPHTAVKDGFRHRFHVAWAAALMRGGVHLGSVYLRDSEGLSEGNLLILQEIAAVVRQLRGPWILGG